MKKVLTVPRTVASCARTIDPISSSAPACMPTALIRSRSMYSVPHLKNGIFSMPEKKPTRTADLDYFYMGIITVPNMETKGSMTTAPNLEAVVKLGESL